MKRALPPTLPPLCTTHTLLANARDSVGRNLVPMNSEATRNPTEGKRVKTGGGPAFHSRLEPHVEFIRQLRRQRKTWKEIAEQLQTEKACSITLQGVHQFYRRYLRLRARPHWERDAAVVELPVVPTQSTDPRRKPLLACTPPTRSFRQPNPKNINLNDPSQL